VRRLYKSFGVKRFMFSFRGFLLFYGKSYIRETSGTCDHEMGMLAPFVTTARFQLLTAVFLKIRSLECCPAFQTT
jgi:hypothetical protein